MDYFLERIDGLSSEDLTTEIPVINALPAIIVELQNRVLEPYLLSEQFLGDLQE